MGLHHLVLPILQAVGYSRGVHLVSEKEQVGALAVALWYAYGRNIASVVANGS